MNTALVTVVTKDYLPGCLSMIKSFLKHNNNFKGDIVIFNCENDLKIKINYKKLKIINISDITFNSTNFKDKTYCTVNNNYNANNRLEIFKLNYDCIIFADSDIIFKNNILSKCKNNKFSVVSTSKQHLRSVKYEKYFDAGLMFIGKKYLNCSIYNEIQDFANSKKFRDDEEILNIFFKGKVTYIDKKYNLLVHEVNQKNLQNSYAIQYVGKNKPWYGKSIYDCFDEFTIKEILKNNKNGLILLKKLKKLYEKY